MPKSGGRRLQKSTNVGCTKGGGLCIIWAETPHATGWGALSYRTDTLRFPRSLWVYWPDTLMHNRVKLVLGDS
jgi:hypothetical protein